MKSSGTSDVDDRPVNIHGFSEQAGSRETPRIFFAILLASPVLIFLLNRDWTFQGFGDYDAFLYFGHFIHFPHYQKLLPSYAGERLPWVLPGYALVHLFTPVYGTLALHFLAYYVSVFSLYTIVRSFSGPDAAFLTALTLGFHPYFLAANGTDYVPGGCIAYCLLTFALLVRSAFATGQRRWVYLFAAGLSWAAVIYTYLFWVVFTPACFAMFHAAEESHGADQKNRTARWRGMALSAGVFTAGALTLTLGLMTFHYLIFGAGGLAFQRLSIDTVRFLSQMRENSWASKSFSVTYADWLVFPGMVAVLSLWLLIPGARRWLGLRAGTHTLLLMYLYFAVVMVVMTIRMTRLLEFDYFASFLLPGAFIVLGVSLFDFPIPSTKPWIWLVVAIMCAISIAPLAKPGLYVKPPVLGAVAPGLLLGGAVAVRLLRPKSLAALAVAILGLSSASFCLEPAVGGIAWRAPGDWMSATRRVAEAVRIIESRLPRDKYPAFWYKEAPPNGLEYQAIMCAFTAHGTSMWNFPEIDAGRAYAPGQVLMLLNNAPGVFDLAAGAMERRGMPLSFLWEQAVTSAGVAYWITATEVRRP
jgi:hypothetical protein